MEKRIRIERDDYSASPREDDNLGTMHCLHGRYKLGDERPLEGFNKIVAKHYADGNVVLPLYLMDHSGLSMSTNPFHCPWDSGQVGWIICDWETAKENWMLGDGDTWKTKVLNSKTESGEMTVYDYTKLLLENEVKTYDQHLRGEVYSLIVEHREPCESCGHGDWEMVDSCGGFYGDNIEENGMLDHLDPDLQKLARKAVS